MADLADGDLGVGVLSYSLASGGASAALDDAVDALGANPLAAFGDCLIWKTHNGEAYHTWRDLALDFYAAGFQAEIRDCGNNRHHIMSPRLDLRRTGISFQRRSGRPVQRSIRTNAPRTAPMATAAG